MEEKKVKVSDLIVIVPARSADELRHNHAKEVPAIVTAIFGSPKICNARVFTDGYHIPQHVTSVPHQSTVGAGGTCWRFADEAVQLPEGDERTEDFAPAPIHDKIPDDHKDAGTNNEQTNG